MRDRSLKLPLVHAQISIEALNVRHIKLARYGAHIVISNNYFLKACSKCF